MEQSDSPTRYALWGKIGGKFEKVLECDNANKAFARMEREIYLRSAYTGYYILLYGTFLVFGGSLPVSQEGSTKND